MSSDFLDGLWKQKRQQKIIVWLLALVVVSVFLAALLSRASFQPVSELTSWYTSREPIDVEIFATVGAAGETRRAEPERVLRFRLERSYVYVVSRSERPSSSSVFLGFDLPTGLPSALFGAPSAEIEPRGDNIQQLDFNSRQLRSVAIQLDGHNLEENFDKAKSELRNCRGEMVSDDLYQFDKDRADACLLWSMHSAKTKYVAILNEKPFLLTCYDDRIGCTMSFPYEGFVPSVTFHASHLLHWRDMIAQSVAFLNSKTYR